jgi:hypothetical protein
MVQDVASADPNPWVLPENPTAADFNSAKEVHQPLTSHVWDTRAEERHDEEKKDICKAVLLDVTNNSRFALYRHV